jgi:hypothetical protein
MCTAAGAGKLVSMGMQTASMLGFMFSLYGTWFLFQRQTVCPRCSGRGRHRSDCPDA